MDFRLHHYPVVGSTNDEVRFLWRQGGAEGTLVRADRQTAGRGRRGRVWVSEIGNLYFSFLLTPSCSLTEISQLSFVMAVAVGEGILSFLPSSASLSYKWPNDVLFEGAKIAGILIESESQGNGLVEACIIGVGINVDVVPYGLAYPVTALNRHRDIPLVGDDIFPPLLQQIRKYYALWQQEGFKPIRETWKRRAHNLGKPITLKIGDKDLRGKFMDINPEGALLLKEEGGLTQTFMSAEVF